MHRGGGYPGSEYSPDIDEENDVCFGLIEEYGVATDWEIVLRKDLGDLLHGDAFFVIVHSDLAVVEIGLGLEYAIDVLQD